MSLSEPPARPHAADRPGPAAWMLLAAAIAASLLLMPLGLLLALAGLARERRVGRDVTAAAFAAVAVLDVVVLTAVGLSLAVAGAVALPRQVGPLTNGSDGPFGGVTSRQTAVRRSSAFPGGTGEVRAAPAHGGGRRGALPWRTATGCARPAPVLDSAGRLSGSPRCRHGGGVS